MSATKQPLRIAFVLDDSLDRPDGVQQYVQTLGRWLTKKGHDVHYIVPDTKRTDMAQVHSIGRSVAVSFNRNTLQVPLPANKQAITDILSSQEFDIVHVQLPHNPFFTGRLLRLLPAHTTIIGTFHVAPYGWFERLATRLLQFLYTRQRRLFSSIISVSSVAKPYADILYKTDSLVLHNAVDTGRFSRGIKSRHTTQYEIRFLGRLVERKGCHFLIQAVARLIEQHPDIDVHLTIGGRGKDEPKLKKMVARLNLADNVDFAGFIDEKEKSQFLADADVVAFPSTGGESFGISLVEAMATPDTVCIGGDNPGYRNVLTPKSVIVDPHNTTAFADLLYQICRDKTYRKNVLRQQSTSAKQYDVNVVGNKLLAVYKANFK